MKSVKFSSEETSKRPSQSLSLEAQAKRRKFLAKFKITKEKLNKDDILSIIKEMSSARLSEPPLPPEPFPATVSLDPRTCAVTLFVDKTL